jgi:AcrR family transcriptional regulator
MSPDREVRRQVRRLELVEAAVRAIRREGPGASMEQMAAEAGVTKPILYRHFGDRGGLYAAVTTYAFEGLDSGLQRALQSVDTPPRQVVSNAIDAYLAFVEQAPELYRFLAQRVVNEPGNLQETIDDFTTRVGRDVALILGEALRAAGADSGAAEPWAFGIVGMVFAAGAWWLERRTMTRARLTAYLTDLVCDGLPDLESLTAGLAADITTDPQPAPDLVTAAPDGDPAVGEVVAIGRTPRRQRQ